MKVFAVDALKGEFPLPFLPQLLQLIGFEAELAALLAARLFLFHC